MSATLSPEQKRKLVKEANRWHSRAKCARTRAERLNYHERAMERVYALLGKPEAGKLL